MISIPFIITTIRVFLLPVSVFVALVFPDNAWLLTALFGIALASDFFDGYIARKWGLVSPSGAFYDQWADKFFINNSMLICVGLGRLPWVWAVLLTMRDQLIAGLREYSARDQIAIPVIFLAKIKTTLQGFLLIAVVSQAFCFGVIQVLFGAALIASYVSGFYYIKKYIEHYW